ncbi:MAG: mRNA interferase MazF [Actinomycetota bacterium]|nr:mRNA interferase MazF [Actinomycetota bacterium]
MRRGEIRLVYWEPVWGAEADKLRPAVIVSNDAANLTASRLGRGVLVVVPITSNVKRIYPFQVVLPAALTALSRDSKAQAEQVRAVAFDRIGERVGRVPESLMLELSAALRLHLDL